MSAESTESAPSESSDTSADVEESPEQGEEPESDEAGGQKEDRSYRSYRRKAEKLRQNVQSFHNERQEWERTKAASGEDRDLATSFRKLRELAQTDGLAALEELGIDFNALTKIAIEEGAMDEGTRKARREMSETKRELERMKRQRAEEEAAREKDARMGAADAQVIEIAKDEDAFPYASQLDPASLTRKARGIVAEMERRELSLEGVTLADLVYAVDRRQAQKAPRWAKVLEKVNAKKKPATPKGDGGFDDLPTSAAPPARRTLSSKDSGNASKKPEKPLTKEERRARSIARLGQYDD